eukprot:361291-Chlamydomonas_euryale.AAC.2
MENFTIDKLMDMLGDSSTPDRPAVRAEIRRRVIAEPDVTTPDAILMRAVDELRQSGWYGVAHSCLVVFADAVPNPYLLSCTQARHQSNDDQRDGIDPSSTEGFMGAFTSGGLSERLVGCARARAEALWCGLAPRLGGCRAAAGRML